MQHGVHEREPVRVVDELAAGEGLLDFEVGQLLGEVSVVVRHVPDVLRSGDHEAERATGRVVAALAGLRLHEMRHDVDEHARREVLARTGFLLVGVLLEQSFIEAAEPLFLGGEPVELVDARDDLLEVLRLVDVCRGSGVDLAHAALRLCAKLVEDFLVVVLEVEAAQVAQRIPAAVLRDRILGVRLLRHLEEEDVGQLRHILMIRDAVVAQDVAEIPELRYDFLCVHADFPPSS